MEPAHAGGLALNGSDHRAVYSRPRLATARIELSAGRRAGLQQHRLHAAGLDRGARFGQVIARVHSRTHLSASWHVAHAFPGPLWGSRSKSRLLLRATA